MESTELIPHLFRTEYSRILAVLCTSFGFEHIQDAEDICSDTFLTAAQTWPMQGIPNNPQAWLYTVAKNKARNFLKRRNVFEAKISPALASAERQVQPEEIDLSQANITDSQLTMMFAVCHPSLSPESQIGLALRILGGFGIQEIADAFLSNKETINKRLTRAKEKLRENKIDPQLPGFEQMNERLLAVLKTIYLIFNEGYFSSNQDSALQKDLCFEAIRLCTMMVENEPTNSPEARALLALMCFHSSRFTARTKGGDVVLGDQDPSQWNRELIRKGVLLLHSAAEGETLSTYHLEAYIAWWHTRTDEEEMDKWTHILKLYDELLRITDSPVAALNRLYAFSKVYGKTNAIKEAEKFNLTGNTWYHTLMGELFEGVDHSLSEFHFHKAISLTRSLTGKDRLARKLVNGE